MGRKPKKRRDAYGAWLHHLRTEKGLTQDELAKCTGVPRSNLAYWEHSGNLIGRKTIIKMAATLGVSVNKLLRSDRFEAGG